MRIVAKDLGKRYNREWIFRNINLSFEPGNLYAITGPNGAGKSTLLRVLWGQLPPTTGSLSYSQDSKVIAAEDAFRFLSIAAPYQELIEEFTLEEMVRFHTKFKKPRLQSVTEIIARMDLSHASGKPISNFSSGMRQRLKLGLAFLFESSALFLDEPGTNLDRRSFEWYRTELASLPSNLTLFIASNNEAEYPPTALKLDISEFKRGY